MPPTATSRARHYLPRLLLAAFSTAAALLATELVLRWDERRIAGSDRLDPGLVQYEEALGWKLTPGWAGRHRHHDFDTEYTVTRHGFRSDASYDGREREGLVAVVGDSFTFGLGVEDGETFVHHLDRALQPGGAAVNFGLPGSSTDQQVLLVERRVVLFHPAELLLVVYLGNDLLDILRPQAIQVPGQKPYFELVDGELELRNVPVPSEAAPPGDTGSAMRRAVLGESGSRSGEGGGEERVAGSGERGFWDRMAARSVLVRRILDVVGTEQDYSEILAAEHEGALDVFEALVLRLRTRCEEEGIGLRLALLGGRSCVLRPSSLSGQYQEHLRREILARRERFGVEVIDLAGAMRERRDEARGWFFKNDGHLTPEGHAAVAKMLAEEF